MTIVINIFQNKLSGPGGGTRRLHQFIWGRNRIDACSKNQTFTRYCTTVIGQFQQLQTTTMLRQLQQRKQPKQPKLSPFLQLDLAGFEISWQQNILDGEKFSSRHFLINFQICLEKLQVKNIQYIELVFLGIFCDQQR